MAPNARDPILGIPNVEPWFPARKQRARRRSKGIKERMWLLLSLASDFDRARKLVLD